MSSSNAGGADSDDSGSDDDSDASASAQRHPGLVAFLTGLALFIAVSVFILRASNVDPGLTINSNAIVLLTAALGAYAAAAVLQLSKGSKALRCIGTGIAVLATLGFVIEAAVWPWPVSDDNVDSYLRKGGDVVIGVRENLPGWMAVPMGADGNPVEGQLSGFDGRLVSFLEHKYGFHVKIETLRNQKQRTEALTGDGPLRADLVIDNFSMTKSRMADVDMAGPYFVDRALIYKNTFFPKPSRQPDGTLRPVRACTVATTTAQSILTSKINGFRDHGYDLQVYYAGNINDCLTGFKQGDYSMTAMDWAIVHAFDPSLRLETLDGMPIRNNDPGLPSYDAKGVLDDPASQVQLYGIGLRKGHPHVCKALTQDLETFIANDWDDAFKDLNAAGVTVATTGPLDSVAPNWHKPRLKDLEEISCGTGIQSTSTNEN